MDDILSVDAQKRAMTLDQALPILVCPLTKEPLQLSADGSALCSVVSGRSYALVQGVPVLLGGISADNATLFEQKYQSEAEPWSYTGRAAERMRHEFVVEIAKRFQPMPRRTLDVGCSRGQLSLRLGEAFSPVFSTDISPTAVFAAQHAISRTTANTADYCFIVASSTALPFAQHTFELIIISDGLHGWELPRPLQMQVLDECFRTLCEGGIAVFTDYLHPRKHHQLLELVEQSDLQIVAVEYLYDRLWYQMESLFHSVQGAAWVKTILRNMPLAQALKRLARLLGAHGSKHLCVVAQKPAQHTAQHAAQHANQQALQAITPRHD